MNGTLNQSSSLLPTAMPHIGTGCTGRRANTRPVIASVYEGPKCVACWSGKGAVTRAKRWQSLKGGRLTIR